MEKFDKFSKKTQKLFFRIQNNSFSLSPLSTYKFTNFHWNPSSFNFFNFHNFNFLNFFNVYDGKNKKFEFFNKLELMLKCQIYKENRLNLSIFELFNFLIFALHFGRPSCSSPKKSWIRNSKYLINIINEKHWTPFSKL